jgi:putative transposase
MRKTRFTEEQIIATLKEVESGGKVQDVIRKRGITEQTYYRWKNKYGGMEVSDAKKLRALEMKTQAEADGRRAGVGHPDAESRECKKMVKPVAYRQAAGFLQSTFDVSQRRACRTLGMTLLLCRYRS